MFCQEVRKGCARFRAKTVMDVLTSPRKNSKGTPSWISFRKPAKSTLSQNSLQPENNDSVPRKATNSENQIPKLERESSGLSTKSNLQIFLDDALESIFTMMGMDEYQIKTTTANAYSSLTRKQYSRITRATHLSKNQTGAMKNLDQVTKTFIVQQTKISDVVSIQKLCRGYLLRKKLAKFNENNIDKQNIIKRKNKFYELYLMEKAYIQQLDKIMQEYLKPIEENEIKGLEVAGKFYLSSNLDALINCERNVYQELSSVVEHPYFPYYFELGDIINHYFANNISIYLYYASNFYTCCETLNFLDQNVPKFHSFLNEVSVCFKITLFFSLPFSFSSIHFFSDGTGIKTLLSLFHCISSEINGKIKNLVNGKEKLEILYKFPLERFDLLQKKINSILESYPEHDVEANKLQDGLQLLKKIENLMKLKLKKNATVLYSSEIKRNLAIELTLENLERPLRLLNTFSRNLIKEVFLKVNGKGCFVDFFNDLLIIYEKQEKINKFNKIMYYSDCTINDVDQKKFELKSQETNANLLPNDDTTKVFLCKNKAEKTELVTVIQEYINNYNTNRIFACPLDKIIARENLSSIPLLVSECMEFLMEYGKSVEGIFRVPGDNVIITDYKRFYDTGEPEIDLRLCSVHDVAGLFKLFLRQLPEPIFPFSTYSRLIECYNQYEKEGNLNVLLTQLAEIIVKLPNNNAIFLFKLSSFLLNFSAFEEQTKMGISNLALVFAPNLIRPQFDTVETVVQTPSTSKLTEMLIEHCDQLWKKISELDHSRKINHVTSLKDSSSGRSRRFKRENFTADKQH